MLILERHVNESILIHVPGVPPIRLMVTEIRSGQRVKLGFSAPREVEIVREELEVKA